MPPADVQEDDLYKWIVPIEQPILINVQSTPMPAWSLFEVNFDEFPVDEPMNNTNITLITENHTLFVVFQED